MESEIILNYTLFDGIVDQSLLFWNQSFLPNSKDNRPSLVVVVLLGNLRVGQRSVKCRIKMTADETEVTFTHRV